MIGRSHYLTAMLLPATALGLVTAAATAQHSTNAAPDRFAARFAPLLHTFCIGCHSGSKPPAGITLSGAASAASVRK
ncbi:MAG TPA: hypothetical protein VKT32_07195, partial [Chthonomonadaceae bacterium]|nr:hypothetical protein [Chthonomonadaceae bacterium]